MNNFTTELKEKLITVKKISESTANLYIKNLIRLNEKQPFEKLTFLKDVEDIDKKLSVYSDNTKKTILASIVSILSLFKDTPSFKKTYKIYYDKMMTIGNDLKNVDTASKTNKQKMNWLSWETITDIKNKLKESVLHFSKNKAINENQYQILLHYIVLLLYYDLPPRRNQDYQFMDVVGEYNNEPSTINLLDYKNKRFIFNKYKTNKKYGQQIVDFKPVDGDEKLKEFNEGLDIYLKFNPLNPKPSLKFPKNTAFPFLVYPNSSTFTAVNSITRILNKIFQKKVSSSMLRHIYLSTKYDIDEMKKDAVDMGHSLNQQREYLKDESETNQNILKK
jgi:hypothetical protein